MSTLAIEAPSKTVVAPPAEPVSSEPSQAPSVDSPEPVAWLCCEPFQAVPLGGKEEVTIGRSLSSDLMLPHKSVSRAQAIIRVREDKLLLENRSSQGTYVNGERVNVKLLTLGDVLLIGPYEILISPEELERDEIPTEPFFPFVPSAQPPPPPPSAEPEPAGEGEASADGQSEEKVQRVSTYYGDVGEESSLYESLDDQEEEEVDEEALAASLPPDAPRILEGSGNGRTYKVLRELGRGGQGVVYEVAVDGNQEFSGFAKPVTRAVAKMALPGAGEVTREALHKEKLVYSHPDPSLVNLLDHGTQESRLFLILERLQLHPFETRVEGEEGVDPGTCLNTFVNLLQALVRLHTRREMPLVLCDIKPGNIMLRMSNKGKLDQWELGRRIRGGAYEPVFMDMGCAQSRALLNKQGGRLEEMVGTPIYLPPEAIPTFKEGEFVPGLYSDKIDVYALSLTLYEYLTGDRPYSTRGLYELDESEFLPELLSLKKEGVCPIQPELLRKRFEKQGEALHEVIMAGLAPYAEGRMNSRALFKLSLKRFRVGESRVVSLRDYHYDDVHGIFLEQRIFSQGHSRW